MIIKQCDFCGSEETEEITLPYPNEKVAIDGKENILMKVRLNGFSYKHFNLCSNCREKLFTLLELLKDN